ncbi:CubicO group peptidase, beta-lactamase class C family [Arthrobacter cupressi]|uniref:CubicO group peptidase, beta-lactamase class C family n=2 Tax=Arthrobacter cupressi TaxID=1045773 RepID=A0A1G8XB59_9MICC|nr:CubicO group peptidase, beta-lactamase class C family [Arthrobacter cupressi]
MPGMAGAMLNVLRLFAAVQAAGTAVGLGLLAPLPGSPHLGADPAFVAVDNYAAVDNYLQDQLDSLGIPGAAVVIIRDGKQVHQGAFGRADDAGRPMTAQTPVLLASTSKSLTAIAVLQQVEAGRLALDEPVQSYLPWFSLNDSRASRITVRHLLHQASGLSSADGTAWEASDTQAPEALEQGVRDLAGASLEGEPGEAFGYSNANFNILGLLVEAVSGQPFGDYMRDHVFRPLAMDHSHTSRASAEADGLARGYSLWFGSLWLQTGVPAPTTGMPSTTMYASAEDLGHELVALIGGGRYADKRILSPESVEAMLTPAVGVDEAKRYAMGWFTRPLSEAASPTADGSRPPLLLEHQGEWGNTHTYTAVVPSSGLGVALVINANDTSAPSRLKALDSNILRILHGQDPAPTVVQEDWLQRNGWVVAAALLLAELVSFVLALVLLLRTRRAVSPGKRWRIFLLAGSALTLDAFLLWLSFSYAPAHFETHLPVIVRQLPDVGFALVPALALAILLPIPRTLWLLSRMLRGSTAVPDAVR